MSSIERIIQVAHDKGISNAFICSKIGVNRTWLNAAKRDNLNISDERLIVIADVLGTSVAYLKGETDDPSPQKEKSPSEVDELSEDEKIVMYMYRSISTLDEKKAFISDLLKRIPSDVSAEVVSLALTSLNTSTEQR